MICHRAATLVASWLLFGVAACGATNQYQSAGPSQAAGAEQSVAPSASASPTPSFPPTPTVAGTMTTTGYGTTIAATWSVGTPEPADPSGQIPTAIPNGAVAACTADNTSSVAASVYIPAQLTVRYSGRLAIQVALEGRPVLHSFAVVAFHTDGGWTCGDTGPVLTVLHPGEPQVFDVLVIAELLSNQHPTLTHEDTAQVAFGNSVVSGDQGAPPLLKISGPGAICAPADVQHQYLFAFRRQPANLDCAQVFQ